MQKKSWELDSAFSSKFVGGVLSRCTLFRFEKSLTCLPRISVSNFISCKSGPSLGIDYLSLKKASWYSHRIRTAFWRSFPYKEKDRELYITSAFNFNPPSFAS